MRSALVHDSVEGKGGAVVAGTEEGFSFRVALVLLMIVVFPLLVVVAYFSTRNVLPEAAGLKISLPQFNFTGVTLHPVNNTNPGVTRSDLFPYLHLPDASNLPYLGNIPQVDFVGVLLIATVAVVVLIVLRGLSARSRRTTPFQDDGDLLAKRRKVAAILDAAASRLNSGSSYRDTVIQCYKMIAELLEEKSDVDGRVLTAREFEERVSKKLRIDSPYLAQVTELFEVARYSEQEITKEQAQEAATCLSNLSAPLKEEMVTVSDIK